MNVTNLKPSVRNVYLILLWASCLLVMFGLDTLVWADNQVSGLVPDAGTLLQEQQRQQQQAPTASDVNRMSSSRLVLPAPESNAVSVAIEEIRLIGPEVLIKEANLEAVVQDAVGQRVDFKGLKFLAHWVTLHLRQAGFLLAQATLPPQDVTSGVLELHIIEGHLDGQAGDLLTIEGEGLRIRESRLESMVGQALDPNDTVRQRDLERSLLLMNDLPGITVRSVLEPGQEDGTTRLRLKVNEDDLLGGMVWGDNYGSRYSGIWRANSRVELNDPWGHGDQVRAYGTVAKDYLSGTVGYNLPVGHQGLRFYADITALDYKLGKDLKSSDLEGSALTLPAKLVYPLIRSRKSNLYLSGGVEIKSLEDTALGVTYRDRRVYSGILSLSGDHRDNWWGGGLTQGYVGLAQGAVDLSGCASDHTSDQATAGVDGGFARLNYRVARIQNLPGSFTLYGAFQGQWARCNLNSSEKFSLGGPYGIRAYPTNEGRGDGGWLANLELRYHLPQPLALGNLQVKAFYDIGQAKLNNDPWTTATNATGRNRYHLSGAGLGISLTQGRKYQITGTWAAAIGDNPGRSQSTGTDADGLDDDQRFWLQAVMWF